MPKAAIGARWHWSSCVACATYVIACTASVAKVLAYLTPGVRRHAGWLALSTLALLCPSHSYAGESEHVGVLVGDLDNPFFQAIGRGVEAGAAKHGKRSTTVTVVSSGYDFPRQIHQIDNMVAKGYGMLILNAVDSPKISDTVLRARRAGTVVVAIDAEAESAQATVMSDNTDIGRIACTYLAKRLDGQGRMVILNGPPVSAIIDRVKGCKTALARFPNVKIVSDDQNAGASLAGGLASMTSLLMMHSHIDAVFAINDPSAIGADLAAAQANRDDFFIVSVDGSPDGVSTLQKAGSRLVATVAQNPRAMAEHAVTIGYSLLQGKEAPKSPVYIPVSLITRDNVASYHGWSQ